MKKLFLIATMFVASALGGKLYAQAQWMNSLNDNIYISQMSLPGAHDAAAKGILSGNCQDKDIAGLWDAGVRVFDLRPTDSGNDCTINHGMLSTGVTLKAALTTINGRLSSNSSEFAIVLMRKEDGGDSWATKVANVISQFSNVMPFSPGLRLGDVRGKILVLSRDYFADGYTIAYWGDNTTRDVKSANGIDFVVQDYYQVEDATSKSTAITNILTEARTNNSTNRMFINHTSGYTGTTGLDSNIKSNANTCNTLAYNTIDANPGPTGIILMDYAGSSSYNGANLVSKIIAQNSNIPTTSHSAPATGQYYVYNVERDMYITRSNDYATRGGFDKAGMPIAVNNAGDGTLTLVTNVNGIGRGIFIDNGNGEKVYVDNTPTSWTFECVDATNQIYTLKNGDNYLQAKDGQTRLEAGALPSNNSAKWQFIPRNVREDLSVATSSNPVDVTYLIENQGFDWYSGEQRSWKNANNNSNWRPGDGWCRNADASNNCAEVWNAEFNICQSFTGVTNGVYELRVQGYYRISVDNNSDYLIAQMRAGNSDIQRTKYYINSTEAYLLPQLSATLPANYADYSVDINGTTYRYPNGKGKASIAFRDGYYENEPIQAIVTDGNLTIGMKLDNKNGQDWNCFDNFRLYYLGLPDISQFTDALEAAIAAAQAFSGNTTTALQNALNTALAEAIAVRESLDTDVLTAKINALNTALANAEAADVTFLSATIPLAQADGVNVTSANDVLANGTTAAQVNDALAALRIARRVANAETHADVFEGNAPAEGDYYLYNVGTGRFFCGGADWGAHAALGFPGILVTLEASGDNFKINTHLQNGDDNGNPKYYLNYGGYCDTWTSDSWKFISQGDGKYNIVRSSNEANLLGYESATYNNVITNCITATSTTNQWKLVTKADRDALLATASETAPQDASYLIKSPGFSQREDVSAWSMTGGASIWGRGANHPDFAIEAYDKTTAGVEQTVTGLPAGTYELKVQAFYRDGNFDTQANILAGGGEARQLATLYAGTKSALIQNVYGGADKAPGIGSSSSVGYMPDGIDDACLYFQSGLYWATLDEIVVGQDGTMTIGARKTEKINNGDWMVLDNFRLIYKGAGIDLTGVKADLLAKIAEANDLLTDLGLDLSYLTTAVTNGQDVYDNSTDADEIVDATNALQSAINVTDNSITDLTVFNQTVALATAEGADASGEVAAVEAVTDASTLAGVVSTQLNNTRTARRLNAVDKQPDVFTGSAPEDGGQYYIYNIGAQRYLTGGVDYGTHAAVNFAAQIATFTQNGEGWRIHTNIRTGRDYLGYNGYVDCEGDGDTWYLIEVSTGVYNISTTNSNTGATLLGYSGERRGNWWQVDTDNQGADLAINQWKLVSKAERDALLATATPENPVDATYYIHAAGFDHHLPDAQLAFPQTKWQTWFPDGKGGNNGIGGWEPDYNWECWNSGNIKFYQTLTGLAPGKYRLSVQGYYRHGNYEQAVSEYANPKTDGAILYATNGNNDTFQSYLVPITSEVDKAPGYGRSGSVGSFPDDRNETAAQFFEFGLYKNVVNEVTVGTDGTLTIGVEKFENNQANEWVVLDNFRLTCLGLTPSADVTIGSANYTTFVAPFNIAELPEDVEAYACQLESKSVHLEPVAAIPAGEAVVLKNTGTYKFYSSAETVSLGTANDLKASDGNVQGGTTIYALANKGGKVGFYPVSESIYVPAGKGYLIIENAVKSFYGFDEDDATSINEELSMKNEESSIYNVAGQRMSKQQKGINIVNGKKILK